MSFENIYTFRPTHALGGILDFHFFHNRIQEMMLTNNHILQMFDTVFGIE